MYLLNNKIAKILNEKDRRRTYFQVTFKLNLKNISRILENSIKNFHQISLKILRDASTCRAGRIRCSSYISRAHEHYINVAVKKLEVAVFRYFPRIT